MEWYEVVGFFADVAILFVLIGGAIWLSGTHSVKVVSKSEAVDEHDND